MSPTFLELLLRVALAVAGFVADFTALLVIATGPSKPGGRR